MKAGLSNILTPRSESPCIATVGVLQRRQSVARHRRLEKLRKFCHWTLRVLVRAGMAPSVLQVPTLPGMVSGVLSSAAVGPIMHCLSEVKRPQREADYLLSSTAKVKTAWRFTSSSALVFMA